MYLTQAERDNLVKYVDGNPEGHVESYFLKANDPTGPRAVWIKFTVFAPRGRPDQAAAEAWAIVFDGETKKHVVVKESHPVATAELGRDRVLFRTGRASLEHGRTRGTVEGDGHEVEWDLAFTTDAPPLHHLPAEWLYGAPLPAKLLTPHPDSAFDGHVVVDGRRLTVRAWPGMQGHNWGRRHSHRLAWGHCNAFIGASDTYFEGLSYQARLGPVTTPWLSMLYLRHEGRVYDFRGARHLYNPTVEVALYRWSFTAEDGDVRMVGVLETTAEDMVGLYYRNPDGTLSHNLNSKIARCRLELSRRQPSGGWQGFAILESRDKAALEIQVREPDHGVRMYV